MSLILEPLEGREDNESVDGMLEIAGNPEALGEVQGMKPEGS
jgi:hypothetical protein